MARQKADVKLLVVDDDRRFLEVMTGLLTRSGFKVTPASSGTEALKILETKSVDLVLSDVHMPNGDGLSLLDAIRVKNSTLPVVIFLTGFGEQSAKDCMRRGAYKVLSKPCARAALLGTINAALGLE